MMIRTRTPVSEESPVSSCEIVPNRPTFLWGLFYLRIPDTPGRMSLRSSSTHMEVAIGHMAQVSVATGYRKGEITCWRAGEIRDRRDGDRLRAQGDAFFRDIYPARVHLFFRCRLLAVCSGSVAQQVVWRFHHDSINDASDSCGFTSSASPTKGAYHCTRVLHHRIPRGKDC